MEKNCPFMQKEGSDCCSIDKLSNPINVGISLFFFNFALIMIDVYDIGVITLISYLALFAILFTVFHIKFMNFFYGKVEEKIEQCEPTQCDEKEEEERFQKCFVSFYTKSNDAIQFLRRIILVKDKFLTAKFILSLYIASQFASALGDFLFFGFIGNDLILLPLVYSRFGNDIKGLWEKGKQISKEKMDLVLGKLPKYQDLKQK